MNGYVIGGYVLSIGTLVIYGLSIGVRERRAVARVGATHIEGTRSDRSQPEPETTSQPSTGESS